MTGWELIPVLSYLIQGGKCRVCRARVSPIYPLTELGTALLFLYAYQTFGFTFEFVIAITFLSMMIIITVSDLAYMIIPDKVLLFFSLVFIAERLYVPLNPWWDSIVGALVGFLLLLAIAIVSRGGMGGGDIKLFAVIGFVMGWKNVLLTFFLACAIGAVIGLILMAFGIVKKGKPIPFGPFITLAAIIVYLYGDPIFSWYFTFFDR
ncbi:leader peptidase (prepilin peptidase)/N-methyltransferase [Oikeobacillus pervagus]|uniref:Leader peptidase (Prepilin peptidase)/N-methyltransferase n=1 Tax=Oikeobacillus pervagus TaxID=1325931 RepID=A0AAJ1SXS0_9BACI|nr:leader peptidase (prepilin peptidase)/N-methyltransferase [Oikeobacillus pervagus]